MDMTLWLRDELLAYRASRDDVSAEAPAFPTATGGFRDKDNLNRRVIGPVARAAAGPTRRARAAAASGQALRTRLSSHVHHVDGRDRSAHHLRAGSGGPRERPADTRDLRACVAAVAGPLEVGACLRRADIRRGVPGARFRRPAQGFRIWAISSLPTTQARRSRQPFNESSSTSGCEGLGKKRGEKGDSCLNLRLMRAPGEQKGAACSAFGVELAGLEPATS